MHYLRQKISALKTSMSSAVVLSVLSLFWQSVQCTVFPPVSNPPPIPGQDYRTLDISGQQFYVQDDLQGGIPQTVIKEDRFFSPTLEAKPDDQWFIPDNESVAKDFPTSSETFERLYANGMPAIGPVATPPPDDNYIAQSTGTSKVFPDTNSNLDSGVFVLTRGPNNQLITERWIPVQGQPSKTIDVVPEENSKILSGSIQSGMPVKGLPVKNQGVPVDNLNVAQPIWVRVPASASLQKGYPNPNVPTMVEEISSVKEFVDVPQPNIKQNFQPQLVKGFPTLPSAPPQPATVFISKSPADSIPPPTASVISNKSPTFVVPPPPPPTMKSLDIGNPKGMVIVNPTVSTIVEKGGIMNSKGPVAQQLKHVWIPTSQKTGNFITFSAGTAINGNQPVLTKGSPVDGVQPVSVSETWILKDDGTAPRFEQQKSLFPVQNMGKEKTIVADTPVLVDSPKGAPTIGKSVDTVVTQDFWPQKSDLEGKTLVKSGLPQQVFPSQKSDAIVVDKTVQMPPQNVKNIVTMNKVGPMFQPQPFPTIPLSPSATLVKGKPPCPIMPQSIIQRRPFPYAAYIPNNVQRQPMARIVRMNRYPFGSYYAVNPRMRSSVYALPRQATIIKQVNNRIIRIIPSSSLPFTMPRRVALPIRQMPLPVTAGKTLTPRFLYPPVQAVSRVRYALPWGSYLSALPTFGRATLPSKFRQAESSSSSSSSESSESKEAPIKIKPKKKEKSKEKSKSVKSESEEKPVENIASSEAVEPESEPAVEPEPELESAESVASGIESEADEPEIPEMAPEPEAQTEAEVPESLELAESQLIHNIAPRSYLSNNHENLKNLGQPYRYGYERRERPSTFLAQETPELGGRVVGRYTYKDENGIYRNIAYISDANGYRTELLNNESAASNQKRIASNLVKEPISEMSTKPSESFTESPVPFNIAFDLPRD